MFQRTPSSVDVRGQRPTDEEWAASLTPGWQRRRMENFLTLVTGGHQDEDLIADGWTSTARLHQKLLPTNAYADLEPDESERLYELADFQKMNEIRGRVASVVNDQAAAEALKPWYRYMCKRPTFSDTYLDAFNEPSVTLVDTADHGGVTRIAETSIFVGEDEYEADCVIFATGFDVGVSGLVSGSLAAYGRGGVSLLDTWRGSGPRTLHGIYCHRFPNLFQFGTIQGAASVNYVHIVDQLAVHAAAVVAEARERGAKYVEPSAEAVDAWVARIREKAADLYKFQAECTPGYYNNEGMPRAQSESFGDGPLAFHELLRTWRASGGMDEILVGC